MISFVLLDAARRYYVERRSEIRFNARFERNQSGSGSGDQLELLTELPNGGARIVRRDDFQGVLEQAIVGAEKNHDPAATKKDLLSRNDQGTGQSPTNRIALDAALRADEVSVNADDLTNSEFTTHSKFAKGWNAGDSPNCNSDGATDRRRIVKPAVSTEPTKAKISDSSGNIDWLERIGSVSLEGEEFGRLPRGADTHAFILYVVSRSEEGFAGIEILETLLSHDVRFGDMDFFHRHEKKSGRGPIQFSIANMMKPGVFDIDNMEALQTRGLMFFVTLPGPSDMLAAFDCMYETAKVFAAILNGDVQDEKRGVMTKQGLEHIRMQIKELERHSMIGKG